jgi:hypothetical protein
MTYRTLLRLADRSARSGCLRYRLVRTRLAA